MADKYEDLIVDIEHDDTFDMTRSELVGARVALQWLDQNRDKVPGRTITESGCHDLYHAAYYGAKAFRGELEDQGFAFIADPEPTNAEKLTKLIREIGYDIRHNGNRSGPVALALDLDARGVKASGGDDEH